MEDKICPKCGYKNPPEAKFCLNCGYKFPDIESGVENIHSLNVYLYLSGLLSIIFLLDSFINDVFRTLILSILFIPYLISLVGILIIIYLFWKKNINLERSRKLFIYGNFLVGLGGLVLFIAPILTGHIVFSLYWIIFLVIAYKVNKM